MIKESETTSLNCRLCSTNVYILFGDGICDRCTRRAAWDYTYKSTGEPHFEFASSPSDYAAVEEARANKIRCRDKKAAIPAKLRTEVLERDRYRCVTCGTHKDLCCDHIFPESLGGKTEEGNLQTLCRSCNSAKGVKV